MNNDHNAGCDTSRLRRACRRAADVALISFAFGMVIGSGIVGLPHVPDGTVQPPPPVAFHLPHPLSPTPPIHAPGTLAVAMAAAFGVMLLSGLNPLHPVSVWLARRKTPQPSLGLWKTWLRGIFAPVFTQGTCRTATLAAGFLGIALWHIGTNAFHEAAGIQLALVPLGVCAVGIEVMLFGRPMKAFRHFGKFMVPVIVFGWSIPISHLAMTWWMGQ